MAKSKSWRHAFEERMALLLLKRAGIDVGALRREFGRPGDVADVGAGAGGASSDQRFQLLDRMGFSLLFDLHSEVDAAVAAHNAWEAEQVRRLFDDARALVAANPGAPSMFLDVGAYWGLYSLIAARSGVFGRIVAFEPDWMNATQLRAQLMLNHFQTVIELREEAISSTVGETTILRSDKHPTMNRGGIGIGGASEDHLAVPMVTLDSVFSISGAAIALKIDVEGHEISVIEGARALLRDNACVLQIENFLVQGTRDQLVALMSELGYAAYDELGPDVYFKKA